jgi:hypothetical protein
MIRLLSCVAAGILALHATTTLADDEPAQAPPPAVEPKAADSDAPLPVGFPDATKPGVIEVKTYPVYRSAKAEGEGMTVNSSDFLFWSLFRHIETKGVAMTAPVINTFESEEMVLDPSVRGKVSMEFMYERPDQGEAGQGVGAVQVVDHVPGKFVCLGVQGRMSDDQMKEGLGQLQTWLEAHKEEWVAAGPPRRLGYHGPMTPVAQRLWEVQIPVKAVGGQAVAP